MLSEFFVAPGTYFSIATCKDLCHDSHFTSVGPKWQMMAHHLTEYYISCDEEAEWPPMVHWEAHFEREPSASLAQGALLPQNHYNINVQ